MSHIEILAYNSNTRAYHAVGLPVKSLTLNSGATVHLAHDLTLQLLFDGCPKRAPMLVLRGGEVCHSVAVPAGHNLDLHPWLPMKIEPLRRTVCDGLVVSYRLAFVPYSILDNSDSQRLLCNIRRAI